MFYLIKTQKMLKDISDYKYTVNLNNHTFNNIYTKLNYICIALHFARMRKTIFEKYLLRYTTHIYIVNAE